MRAAFSTRIAKLEQDCKPVVRLPHVLTKRHDETIEQSLARFVARWGAVPRNHLFLVVPPRDRTPEENAEFEARFKAQQIRLVSEARSHRSPQPTKGA